MINYNTPIDIMPWPPNEMYNPPNNRLYGDPFVMNFGGYTKTNDQRNSNLNDFMMGMFYQRPIIETYVAPPRNGVKYADYMQENWQRPTYVPNGAMPMQFMP